MGDFANICLPGFCLDSGCAQNQAKLATLNPKGAPSTPGRTYGLGTGLFAGGLPVASCQKQVGGVGGGRGIVLTPTGRWSWGFKCLITKVFIEFLGILLSCLTFCEVSVLTWHPAGVVHAMCMREGPISWSGVGKKTSGQWDCF